MGLSLRKASGLVGCLGHKSSCTSENLGRNELILQIAPLDRRLLHIGER